MRKEYQSYQILPARNVSSVSATGPWIPTFKDRDTFHGEIDPRFPKYDLIENKTRHCCT